MTRRSLRSRLLGTTAALSVVLASMTPARLPAQEAAPAEVPPVAAPSQTTPPEAEAPAPTPVPEEPAPEPEAAPEPEPEAEAPAETAPEPAPSAAPEPEPEATPDAEEPEATEPEATEAPDIDEPATNRTDEPEPPATRDTDADTPADTDVQAPAAGGSDADTTAAPDTGSEPETPAARTTDTEAPAAAEPVAPPTEVDEAEAVDTLNSVLGGDAEGAAPAAAAVAAGTEASSDTATVTEVTEENARSSSEDFTTTASGESRDRDDDDDDDGGLSNLQKAGLLALGGLAVGALMNNGKEVVSNTGDRVVLRQNDGTYQVLKDDDALLRQPGSTVRTENYADGSTRSIVEQADGSRIETIRDASGRVLRRARIDTDGRQTLLIDDTRQAAPVDLSLLPRSREDVRVSATDRTSLRQALERIETRDNARQYSLSQIRDYREVRALAPVVDVDNITFRTGSAAVEASQAEELADLGNLMRDLIDDRPGEVFLIEGHTDAVGSAASNLALSDRRAESVALALTEYFDVPPENMVVQGYGESDLRIDADGDEPRNRRVAVRIITPVLQVAQNR